MDSNSILDKTFTKAMSGYAKEEVDEFLSDMAREFSRIKKENEDLEKKLQVCADKIREYREDEDALKDALLGAQKQGNAIISESKEKGAKIISDAEEKSTEMMQEADDYVAQRKAEAEKIIADALAEKKRIEDEAQKRADDIHAQMMIQTELDKEVLARTKREAEDFRTRIIIEYNNHIEFIKNIPEQCENEFVRDNYQNHNSNTLRELIASQQGVSVPDIPEPEDEEDEDEETQEQRDSDVKVVEDVSEIDVLQSELGNDEEEDGAAFTVNNAFDSGEKGGSVPDFLSTKPQRQNNGSKFEKLEFGSSSDSRPAQNNGGGKKKKR